MKKIPYIEFFKLRYVISVFIHLNFQFRVSLGRKSQTKVEILDNFNKKSKNR